MGETRNKEWIHCTWQMGEFCYQASVRCPEFSYFELKQLLRPCRNLYWGAISQFVGRTADNFVTRFYFPDYFDQMLSRWALLNIHPLRVASLVADDECPLGCRDHARLWYEEGRSRAAHRPPYSRKHAGS